MGIRGGRDDPRLNAPGQVHGWGAPAPLAGWSEAPAVGCEFMCTHDCQAHDHITHVCPLMAPIWAHVFGLFDGAERNAYSTKRLNIMPPCITHCASALVYACVSYCANLRFEAMGHRGGPMAHPIPTRLREGCFCGSWAYV